MEMLLFDQNFVLILSSSTFNRSTVLIPIYFLLCNLNFNLFLKTDDEDVRSDESPNIRNIDAKIVFYADILQFGDIEFTVEVILFYIRHTK